MRRALLLVGPVLLLGVLAGCRLPPDIDELKPFKDDKPLPNYGELYDRARAQASAAVERFYADDWADLVELAKGLEQTARWMPRTKDAPADRKATESLEADAAVLLVAARNRDVRAVGEVMQRIQFTIRTLRPKTAPKDGKDAPGEPPVK